MVDVPLTIVDMTRQIPSIKTKLRQKLHKERRTTFPRAGDDDLISHLLVFPYQYDHVQFCKGHTQDWARKLSDVRFKFIFIDADHQYESTKQDFEFWSPLLEAGGLIAFHDINLNTVRRVIDEKLNSWELVDFVCNIQTFRRIL